METSITTTTPSAGEAANAEYSRIMTDPTHPMHDGYKRSDEKVLDHISNLYRHAYPASRAGQDAALSDKPKDGNATALPGGALESSPEDRLAQAETEARLRHVLGDEYSEVMREAGLGAACLFAGPKGLEALDLVAPAITELGVHAEVMAIRFLSELGKLRQAHLQQGGIR